MLVLVDPLGGQLARDDLAEDAVLVGHGGVPYSAAVALLTETELRERVERLAAIERGSASAGRGARPPS